jgi:hypothetical protein
VVRAAGLLSYNPVASGWPPTRIYRYVGTEVRGSVPNRPSCWLLAPGCWLLLLLAGALALVAVASYRLHVHGAIRYTSVVRGCFARYWEHVYVRIRVAYNGLFEAFATGASGPPRTRT